MDKKVSLGTTMRYMQEFRKVGWMFRFPFGADPESGFYFLIWYGTGGRCPDLKEKTSPGFPGEAFV